MIREQHVLLFLLSLRVSVAVGWLQWFCEFHGTHNSQRQPAASGGHLRHKPAARGSLALHLEGVSAFDLQVRVLFSKFA